MPLVSALGRYGESLRINFETVRKIFRISFETVRKICGAQSPEQDEGERYES